MNMSPFLATAFICVGLYGLVILGWPVLGAYAYAFTLGFAALLNVPITHDGLRLSTVLVLIGFAAWAGKAIISSNDDMIVKPLGKLIHILMGLILITMVVSLINSRNIGASVGEIKQFSYCLIAYYFILFTIDNKIRLKNFILFLVLTGFVVSIFGVMEGTTENIYSVLHKRSLLGAPLGRAILWTSADRINGLIGDGDNHGMYMGTVLVFTLSLFFMFRSRMLRGFLLLVMSTCVFNIVGAASRGAVLGAVIALFVFFILIDLRKKWLIVGGASVALFIAGSLMILTIPDLNIERLYNPGKEANKTVDLRMNNILIGVAMAKDHPIIGHGPDGFMLNYLRYGPRITPTARSIPTKPLNAYVQAFVEYGIVGFSLFSLMTVLIIWNLFRRVRTLEGSFKYLVTGVFASFCGYTFFLNTTGFFVDQTYWLLVALAGAIITIVPNGQKKTIKASPRFA
jgi:O-antigen ligase